MQQVKKPKRPLYIYYLIALAVLIFLNALIFPKFMGNSGLRYLFEDGRKQRSIEGAD